MTGGPVRVAHFHREWCDLWSVLVCDCFRPKNYRRSSGELNDAHVDPMLMLGGQKARADLIRVDDEAVVQVVDSNIDDVLAVSSLSLSAPRQRIVPAAPPASTHLGSSGAPLPRVPSRPGLGKILPPLPPTAKSVELIAVAAKKTNAENVLFGQQSTVPGAAVTETVDTSSDEEAHEVGTV